LALSAVLLAEGKSMLRVSKQKINRGLTKLSKIKKVSAQTKVCGNGWGSFNQWDTPWKTEKIDTKTIGAVGCAMTSVTNALKSRVDKIGADDVNPSTVNTYLKDPTHNGYAGNCIKWAAIGTAGLTVHMTFKKDMENPTAADLKAEVEACNAAILNVHNGGHWVLATGAAEGDIFNVKDPGFDTTSYPIAEIKRAIIYEFKEDGGAAAKVKEEGSGADGGAAAPPAAEAAAVPEAPVPAEGEAAVAAEAAADPVDQPEIQLTQPDIDLLLTKNGGAFGDGGGPDVAAGGEAVAAADPAAAAPAPAPAPAPDAAAGAPAVPAVPPPA